MPSGSASASTRFASAPRSARHRDGVVLFVAIDQFAERIDSGPYRAALRDGERDPVLAGLHPPFLERDDAPVRVERADVDVAIERHFGLLAAAVRADLARRDDELDRVAAVRLLFRRRAHR